MPFLPGFGKRTLRPSFHARGEECRLPILPANEVEPQKDTENTETEEAVADSAATKDLTPAPAERGEVEAVAVFAANR